MDWTCTREKACERLAAYHRLRGRGISLTRARGSGRESAPAPSSTMPSGRRDQHSRTIGATPCLPLPMTWRALQTTLKRRCARRSPARPTPGAVSFERFERLLRDIGRQYRLAPADLEDAMQTTWLQLFRRLSVVREPAALPGWLASRCAASACARCRRPVAEVLVGEAPMATEGLAPDPLSELLDGERRDALRRALATLPRRHRQLMRLLVDAPGLSHAEIGQPARDADRQHRPDARALPRAARARCAACAAYARDSSPRASRARARCASARRACDRRG